MSGQYEVVVGLEVHAELATASKLFCGCKNAFGAPPNTLCCPVCTGMPGALPVLNKKAVEYAVLAGLAFCCRINRTTALARKQYFYPDLPKAYQISQSDVPLCVDGHLDILVGGACKRIGITRVQIEEDAGKLSHSAAAGETLADYNRCGVPLVEIVSEPDMRGADEAKAFLEGVAAVLRHIGVSEVKMQEGGLRADVNVSVRPQGQAEPGVRVEMKNVNSFSAVQRAVMYEAKRQAALLDAGGVPKQETRRWDDANNQSVPLRAKEDRKDYRFFPDPDLLPFTVPEQLVASLKAALPELPLTKTLRYCREFGLPLHTAALLAGDAGRAAFFEAAAALEACGPKLLANWMTGDVARILNETNSALAQTNLTPEHLVGMIAMIERGSISNAAGKTILPVMMRTGAAPETIILSAGLAQISDEAHLDKLVKAVLEKHPAAVADYRKGKRNAAGFLVGQCMKESNGQANPAALEQLVHRALRDE